jgi:hypothetical protein
MIRTVIPAVYKNYPPLTFSRAIMKGRLLNSNDDIIKMMVEGQSEASVVR